MIIQLCLDLLKNVKDKTGKYFYYLAGSLLALYPNETGLMKSAKENAENALKRGYPGSDELLKKVRVQLGENLDAENAEVEKHLEEMKKRMELAETTPNRNLYLALCLDGTGKYSDEREKELAIEAARRYNRSVDLLAAGNDVKEDQLHNFYTQRRVNVAMAKDGVQEFMSRAADALRDGYDNIRQDLVTAREYYRIAAENGDQHAQLYYGVFCKEGYGGPKDYIEAEDSFMKAWKGPDQLEAGRAAFNLGTMNYEGLGIPKDEKTAVMYWQDAREKGWNENVEKEFRIQCINVDTQLTMQRELGHEYTYRDEKTGSYFLPPRC